MNVSSKKRSHPFGQGVPYSRGGGHARGIEQGARAQHGTGDGQQPIGYRAQCAAMRVAAGAQGAVLGATDRIVLDGDSAPVIAGVYQRAWHARRRTTRRILPDRRVTGSDAAQAAQGLIVSRLQRAGGFR